MGIRSTAMYCTLLNMEFYFHKGAYVQFCYQVIPLDHTNLEWEFNISMSKKFDNALIRKNIAYCALALNGALALLVEGNSWSYQNFFLFYWHFWYHFFLIFLMKSWIFLYFLLYCSLISDFDWYLSFYNLL